MTRSNSELLAQIKVLRFELQQGKSKHSNTHESALSDKASATHSTHSEVTIKENELQIEALRLKVADLESRLMEQSVLGLAKHREIEEDLLQAKLENIRLSENVESYQMLLQERTLRGDYPVLALSDDHNAGSESSRSASPYGGGIAPAVSLATEMEEAVSSELKGSHISIIFNLPSSSPVRGPTPA